MIARGRQTLQKTIFYDFDSLQRPNCYKEAYCLPGLLSNTAPRLLRAPKILALHLTILAAIPLIHEQQFILTRFRHTRFLLKFQAELDDRWALIAN